MCGGLCGAILKAGADRGHHLHHLAYNRHDLREALVEDAILWRERARAWRARADSCGNPELSKHLRILSADAEVFAAQIEKKKAVRRHSAAIDELRDGMETAVRGYWRSWL